ncbi:MAG: hypothetical protein LWW93_15345, partial [Hyphomicrobiales bacterium]|nr:hypothetical protein [Hyphomicrobiales bacterium]
VSPHIPTSNRSGLHEVGIIHRIENVVVTLPEIGGDVLARGEHAASFGVDDRGGGEGLRESVHVLSEPVTEPPRPHGLLDVHEVEIPSEADGLGDLLSTRVDGGPHGDRAERPASNHGGESAADGFDPSLLGFLSRLRFDGGVLFAVSGDGVSGDATAHFGGHLSLAHGGFLLGLRMFGEKIRGGIWINGKRAFPRVGSPE